MNGINDYLDKFKESLKNVGVTKIHEFTIKELTKQKKWGEWSYKQGVYIFKEKEKIVYVGRALTTLGSRVYGQIRAFGDPDWDRIIKNSLNTVIVICVHDNMRPIASALEVFLIEKIKPRPEFNKRIQ